MNLNRLRLTAFAVALTATLAVPSLASAHKLGTTNIQKKNLSTIAHEPIT